MLGELVQTTAGKWIIHPPARCPKVIKPGRASVRRCQVGRFYGLALTGYRAWVSVVGRSVRTVIRTVRSFASSVDRAVGRSGDGRVVRGVRG
jgi:hypothetical protein